ncbi:Casein kinase II regulatory subunit alpha-helical [Penicillium vulpinum]|nr:Casein kinase II regulatory subunit alpha-helical [Penicillium vulpinum]KAJ5951159.1 Casein kinase II regulatory subunit alpha-helical [Penicillium vulpinum]
MDPPVFNWLSTLWVAFLNAGMIIFFQRAYQSWNDGDMYGSLVDTFTALIFTQAYLKFLRVYIMVALDPSILYAFNFFNHPRGPPPGSGSNPSGQRSQPTEQFPNHPPRNPGRGGSSTSRSSNSSTSTGSRRFNLALLMVIVLTAIMYLQFVSSRGNEYFCEIDEDYLTDRFNLTGLNTEVSYYQYALDLVTDVFDLDADDDLREQIEKSARHLYGLVHARYIVTTRGLAKMLEKYKKSDFGKCPRVMCDGHALLPLGESDLPNISTVKLYCPKCEDIYNPKSSRHSSIDGAYFGTSFHSILFQVYPALNPEKSSRRYEPRIYGFKVHAAAALARFQDNQREELKWRLAEADINHRFIEDSESDDDAFEYDEDYAEGNTEPAKKDKLLGDTAATRMSAAK